MQCAIGQHHIGRWWQGVGAVNFGHCHQGVKLVDRCFLRTRTCQGQIAQRQGFLRTTQVRQGIGLAALCDVLQIGLVQHLGPVFQLHIGIQGCGIVFAAQGHVPQVLQRQCIGAPAAQGCKHLAGFFQQLLCRLIALRLPLDRRSLHQRNTQAGRPTSAARHLQSTLHPLQRSVQVVQVAKGDAQIGGRNDLALQLPRDLCRVVRLQAMFYGRRHIRLLKGEHANKTMHPHPQRRVRIDRSRRKAGTPTLLRQLHVLKNRPARDASIADVGTHAICALACKLHRLFEVQVALHRVATLGHEGGQQGMCV